DASITGSTFTDNTYCSANTNTSDFFKLNSDNIYSTVRFKFTGNIVTGNRSLATTAGYGDFIEHSGPCSSTSSSLIKFGASDSIARNAFTNGAFIKSDSPLSDSVVFQRTGIHNNTLTGNFLHSSSTGFHVVMNEVQVSNNKMTNGGFLYANKSDNTAKITDCNFINNRAEGYGAPSAGDAFPTFIYNLGALTIQDSRFVGNHCESTFIFNPGALLFTSSIVSKNTLGLGFISKSTANAGNNDSATITGCAFTDNHYNFTNGSSGNFIDFWTKGYLFSFTGNSVIGNQSLATTAYGDFIHVNCGNSTSFDRVFDIKFDADSIARNHFTGNFIRTAVIRNHDISPADSIVFRNMSICNNTSTEHFVNASVSFMYPYHRGLFVKMDNVKVSDNRMTNGAFLLGDANHAKGSITGSIFTNNRALNEAGTGTASCWFISYPGLAIENSRFVGNTSYQHFIYPPSGYTYAQPSSFSFTGNTVKNNTTVAADASFIYADGYQVNANIVFSADSIADNQIGNHFIHKTGIGTTNIDVTGAVVDNNETGGSFIYHDGTEAASTVAIRQNRITRNRHSNDFIRFSGNSRFKFTGNIVTDNLSQATMSGNGDFIETFGSGSGPSLIQFGASDSIARNTFTGSFVKASGPASDSVVFRNTVIHHNTANIGSFLSSTAAGFDVVMDGARVSSNRVLDGTFLYDKGSANNTTKISSSIFTDNKILPTPLPSSANNSNFILHAGSLAIQDSRFVGNKSISTFIQIDSTTPISFTGNTVKNDTTTRTSACFIFATNGAILFTDSITGNEIAGDFIAKTGPSTAGADKLDVTYRNAVISHNTIGGIFNHHQDGGNPFNVTCENTLIASNEFKQFYHGIGGGGYFRNNVFRDNVFNTDNKQDHHFFNAITNAQLEFKGNAVINNRANTTSTTAADFIHFDGSGMGVAGGTPLFDISFDAAKDSITGNVIKGDFIHSGASSTVGFDSTRIKNNTIGANFINAIAGGNISISKVSVSNNSFGGAFYESNNPPLATLLAIITRSSFANNNCGSAQGFINRRGTSQLMVINNTFYRTFKSGVPVNNAIYSDNTAVNTAVLNNTFHLSGNINIDNTTADILNNLFVGANGKVTGASANIKRNIWNNEWYESGVTTTTTLPLNVEADYLLPFTGSDFGYFPVKAPSSAMPVNFLLGIGGNRGDAADIDPVFQPYLQVDQTGAARPQKISIGAIDLMQVFKLLNDAYTVVQQRMQMLDILQNDSVPASICIPDLGDNSMFNFKINGTPVTVSSNGTFDNAATTGIFKIVGNRLQYTAPLTYPDGVVEVEYRIDCAGETRTATAYIYVVQSWYGHFVAKKSENYQVRLHPYKTVTTFDWYESETGPVMSPNIAPLLPAPVVTTSFWVKPNVPEYPAVDFPRAKITIVVPKTGVTYLLPNYGNKE
ncbi:MAG: hypothetical protein LBU62_09645, partial [Bacteroidales bacterium]|nr:hypothetical protein [Bacteroidales bacterium]